jgi:decaprenylphospho-beta-D-ribofuranose 2-oxidase
MIRLAGWGRAQAHPTTLLAPRDAQALAQVLRDTPSLIARGAGRAYGDSAVNGAVTISMRHFNRFVQFDTTTGALVAEAHVTMGDIIRTFLPRGWFPVVLPGTEHVTLGGAIAADVHGKNHLADGSFGAHLDWVEVMGPDDGVQRHTRGTEGFMQTLGGMGLTGVILRASLRLRAVETGWLRTQSLPTAGLSETIDALQAQPDWRYRVAWLDCMGAEPRGIVTWADHARHADLPRPLRARPLHVPEPRRLSVPLPLPALHPPLMRAFNAVYHWAGRRKAGPGLQAWAPFFFPLDGLGNWNRLYGRAGLVQFQCALPPEQARAGLAALLAQTRQAGLPPYLAVLKRLGAAAGGLSFAIEGFTLALDFPATPRAFALLERLDAITLAHGGRFYLAKDCRLPAATLHASDPRAAAFRDWRAGQGLGQFASLQSQRVKL